MNGSLISIKNVSLVTMLAAGAAAIYVLNSPQKTKEKGKLLVGSANNAAIAKMMNELQGKRAEILRKFEESGNQDIPTEMLETMSYIYERDPNKHPAEIRLLCSQLIQDYIIMYGTVHGGEPDQQVIKLARAWLDFVPGDIQSTTDQINHRYALALRSRSVKEFYDLHKWLHEMNSDVKKQKSVGQNWTLRNFQCSCLLGYWKQAIECGRIMENTDPEVSTDSPLGQQSVVPLHPLHLFDYIALKLPQQSPNFTQVYYNAERYAELFDPRLSPPLRFGEWKILDCVLSLKFAFSSDDKKHKELQHQIAIAKPSAVNNFSKLIFVFGCLVQYPCSWVQLPSQHQQPQPAVLCGPWNDTEMELTASYIQRSPSNAQRETDEKSQDKEKTIEVTRSDFRLHLDRTTPSMTGSIQTDNQNAKAQSAVASPSANDNDNNDNFDEMSQSLTSAVGWVWHGTFDHEEGTVEIQEKNITSFAFRKDYGWKEKALKCTCRTWDIQIVMATPD